MKTFSRIGIVASVCDRHVSPLIERRDRTGVRPIFAVSLNLIAAMAMTVGTARRACGQLGMFSSEQRAEFTREWEGERFPGGRPGDEAVRSETLRILTSAYRRITLPPCERR